MPDFLCQPGYMAYLETDSDMLLVRPATMDDAESIAEIYAAHVCTGTASFDTEHPSVAETVGKIVDIQSKGWPFLVAQRDAEVVRILDLSMQGRFGRTKIRTLA